VPELLERADLLARLEELRSQGGRLVFVGGEAGVGKTSLVRAFAAGKEAQHGWCENLTTATPLGPFLDVGIDAETPREVAAELLTALGRTPLLVLEDVHWADQATLDVLRVLGRRIERTEALVLATYRDDEVDSEHPLRALLGELASAPGVDRVAVPQLSVEAVRLLAEPHGADADAIHRLTSGNAFYVTEILAAGGSTLPATVRDAVLARAASFGRDARRLLDVVALVPGRIELSLLEAVAPGELEALDDCLASGVLRADGDGVAFRHELARLAFESAVAPQRRRALHRAIAAELAPTGDHSRLAHHAEEAGDAAAVLEHAPEAARRAALVSAHREAAAQYARALRHAGRLDPAARAELLAAYGQELHVTGRHSEAIGAYLGAIELHWALGNSRREGELLAIIPTAYIALGRNAEAEAASLRAIELLERLPPGPELASAYGMQASLRMLNRDNADGVVWGERALAAAERLDDDEGRSFALNMIGTSRVLAGEIEPGVEALLRSLELARALDNEVRINSALGMLGTGLGEMYELEAAEEYLEQQIAFGESREIFVGYARAWLACVHLYRGRWSQVPPLARLAVSTASQISQITGLIALGRLRARRGDPGVWEVLDEALELSEPGGHLQRLGHVRAARAEAAWLAGDAERTVEEARAVYGLALEKRHLWFAGELAYWQWKAGALEAAPERIAEPYRLQLDGDAHAAAMAWRRRLCPYEEARTLADAGDEAAFGQLERLGARPLVDDLRRRLGRRGPRGTTRGNPAGLTARELEVLELLVGGLQNREIADRLVLSPRTVDHHVSAVLRKLGAKSRVEAVARFRAISVAAADNMGDSADAEAPARS
jgi:DNA-binding CsgD family transcriptional regulator/tetratricopeptide (TPR) repeat protein